MNCRYRFGDVLFTLFICVAVIAMSIRLGVVEHKAWFAIPIGMFLVSSLGTYINMKERRQEEIQRIRERHQRSLGVPPDEI